MKEKEETKKERVRSIKVVGQMPLLLSNRTVITNYVINFFLSVIFLFPYTKYLFLCMSHMKRIGKQK